MSTEKTPSFKLSQAAQVKWELSQLDLSYAPEDFNVREARFIVQQNVIGISDVLRAIEPQEKEINELMVEYNQEASDLNRKYSIGVKDVVLTKDERFEYEAVCEVLKAKHKKNLDSYQKKVKELNKLMDEQECQFVLKKEIKKEMLPPNITANDMAILSRLMEW